MVKASTNEGLHLWFPGKSDSAKCYPFAKKSTIPPTAKI